jgi:hypothetical protein
MFNKLNTNITVEKIDTTETATKQSSKNSKFLKSSKESSKSIKTSSKKTESLSKKSKSIKESTKLTNIIENDIIKDIETLEDIPLVLSNISENDKDSYIHTDTLLKSKKQKKIKSTKYTLIFPKTVEVDNNKYKIINKYVKKNYNHIVNLLYDKNLLKNKDSPYRIIFHIYVNYLHEDLNIIFE